MTRFSLLQLTGYLGFFSMVLAGCLGPDVPDGSSDPVATPSNDATDEAPQEPPTNLTKFRFHENFTLQWSETRITGDAVSSPTPNCVGLSGLSVGAYVEKGSVKATWTPEIPTNEVLRLRMFYFPFEEALVAEGSSPLVLNLQNFSLIGTEGPAPRSLPDAYIALNPPDESTVIEEEVYLEIQFDYFSRQEMEANLGGCTPN